MSTKRIAKIIGIATLVAGVIAGGDYLIVRHHSQKKEECIRAGMEFYFERDFYDNSDAVISYHSGYHEKEARESYFDPKLDLDTDSELSGRARRLGRTVRSWLESQCSQ